MKFVTALVILCFACASFAAKVKKPWDSFAHPKWKINCKVGDSKVVIKFESKSGQADNDDMQMKIDIDGKTITTKSERALYEALPVQRKGTSACDHLPSFLTDEGLLLVLYGTNDRPAPSYATGLLIDTKARKVLESGVRLGNYMVNPDGSRGTKSINIENKENGLRILLQQGFKSVQAKGISAFHFEWKEVEVADNKIAHNWEQPLPKEFKEGY